ncbi:MAG: hypothetical protein C0503_03525 [Gemmatimonas sp.]|nr:hypothetical protein [Gemmatimonas sp.]
MAAPAIRRPIVALATLLTLGSAACLSPTDPPAGQPALLELTPAELLAGSGPQTVTLRGSRFSAGSQVRVNDEDVRTTFVNVETLRAELPERLTALPNDLIFQVLNADDLTSSYRMLPVRQQPLVGWEWSQVIVTGGSWDVAVAPSGEILAGGYYSGALTRVDATNLRVIGSTPTANWPYDVAIDGSRNLAYTAGLDEGQVDVIDLSTFTRTQQFRLATRPIRVALNADRTRLFATTLSDLRLVSLDVATGAAQGSGLDIQGIGNGLALTPDGQRLWVTTTNGLVHIVSPATLALQQTISVGGIPQDVVINAAGTRAYVANENGWINVFDAASGARLDSIPAPIPFGLALQPGSDRLWVAASRRGEIYVIDLTTGRLRGGRRVGGAPRTIVFDGLGRALIANESGFVHIASPVP